MNEWIDYIVVTDSDPDKLTAEVTRCLREGYELHGDLKVVVKNSVLLYVQALVRHGQPSYG